MITTSTALHLAGTGPRGRRPVLACRPHGVLHVVPNIEPGRRTIPPSRRPVCGRPHRRLHVVPDRPSAELVGHHQNGQRVCARCLAHLARASQDRAGWAANITGRAKVRRQELVTDHIAGGEAHTVLVGDLPVGTIARTKQDTWRVHEAGLGVPVDRRRLYATRDRAVTAVAIARELALLPGGALREVDGLTELDRTILDFAGRTYFSPGRREADIRHELQMSATRYFQRLNKLIDTPAAERYAPQTVHRRRRLRDHHKRRRRLPTLPATPITA